MKKNLIETLVGAFVLLVAGMFINTAINSSGVSKKSGYEITAQFDRIDGVGEPNNKRFIALEQRVAFDSDRNDLGRFARDEGERAGQRREILPGQGRV